MTIERPMFPPGRDNPFRLVGGVDLAQERTAPTEQHYDDPSEKISRRSRDDIQRAIHEHEVAREIYGRAASWAALAEHQDMPQAQIEQARSAALAAYHEMKHKATMLIFSMEADPRGLVDLLLYLEKNFSILPQEINGRSLSYFLLRSMRLSLRRVARYGKVGVPRS